MFELMLCYEIVHMTIINVIKSNDITNKKRYLIIYLYMTFEKCYEI